MKDKVHLRCDANAEIGLGHLYRCLAVADIIGQYFDIVFYLNAASDRIRSVISVLGFELVVISHEEQFLSALKDKSIVVMDGYSFNSDFQKAVKNKGALLVFIDDLHQGYYWADVIINHAGGAVKEMYQTSSNTKLYLGEAYALLRKVFVIASLKLRSIEKMTRIFVCFGGSANDELILKNLTLLNEIGYFYEIHLLLGQVSEDTFQRIKIIGNIHLYQDIDASQVCDVMTQCDIAFVPASNISLEAYAVGLFMIVGIAADNQRDIYEGYRDVDFIYRVGDLSELDRGNLWNAIRYFERLSKPYVINRKKINSASIKNIFLNLRSICFK